MPNRQCSQTPRWLSGDLPTPSRDYDVLLEDLRTYGFAIIERALEGARLERLQQRLFEQAAAERQMHNLKNPANTDPVNQWVGMLLNKGDEFFGLIDHPLACRLIESVLGPHWLVSCVDAQVQHPGSRTMPLHTDQWWMPPPVPGDEVHTRPSTLARGTGTALDPLERSGPVSAAMAANVMWMVTDFTEENGATRVVPRSHLSGRQPDASVPHKVASVPACGEAGTAFVFDARLWHGAGENRTADPRFGVTTMFSAPQCRPLENYSRGLRADVYQRCSPETLARLGFAAWSSYGHTGDPDSSVVAAWDDATGPLSP